MLNNYNHVRENLGYSSTTDRVFRDALLAANINPREAESKGIPEKLVNKIPKNTAVLEAANAAPAHNVMSTSVDTVAITQIQRKLGIDDHAMTQLCKEFGVSKDQSLSQPDAIALCELAMELYGLQLNEELGFISDRQALLFKQQQDTAYQLGYLQESAVGNAHQRGRIEARSKILGKQETEVRSAQQQVFSLLGQAGKSLKGREQTAKQAHQAFTLGLWQ